MNSTYKILGLNGNTLGVDGSQVGVLEEGDEVSLGGLLESHDCRGLEAKIGLEHIVVSHIESQCLLRVRIWRGLPTRTYLEVLSDFTDQTLEGELADEQLRRLLITSNFSQGDSTGPETMGFLDTTGCRLHFV